MRTYSISFIALTLGLLWLSANLPDPGNDLKTPDMVSSITNGKTKPLTSWSGSWPSGSGYHSYGNYAIDASGIPDGNNIVVNFSAQNVPNRFYLKDNCGLTGSPQPWAVSNPSAYNGYVGDATYGGPWGMSMNTFSGGQLIVQKRGGCTSWTLTVETSTGPANDAWTASF